ncbi:hypothetical protein BOTBODRAFT_126729 [Botryobasidium botryosum FD-172 SS1]|uniref:SH3 domain-containing protein n=1 Tax=Botryobasidium botryosum (strain FD-172 SS1) TaxID=930990 RepID=A0A067MT52_BOTB1|nr:hypothetical protein BOTBODRAFT_126729 [Botryobasidium botryosum FD-172 SS1]
MACYDIYSGQLAALKRGFILWEPEPDAGDCSQVEVGDVGYTLHGSFQSLFNILRPANHPSQTRGVPECFEQLVLPEANQGILSRVMPAGKYMTREVHHVEVAGGALSAVPEVASGGGKVGFQSYGDTGAALATTDEMCSLDILHKTAFQAYMRKHIDYWVVFAYNLQLGIKEEDIILVTGCDLTTSWAAAAAALKQEAQDVSTSPETGLLGGSGSLASRSAWSSDRHVGHNLGPHTRLTQGAIDANPGALVLTGNTYLSQSSSSLAQVINTNYNQRIFIRSYRWMKRMFLPLKKMRIAAKSADPEYDDDHSPLMAEIEGVSLCHGGDLDLVMEPDDAEVSDTLLSVSRQTLIKSADPNAQHKRTKDFPRPPPLLYPFSWHPLRPSSSLPPLRPPHQQNPAEPPPPPPSDCPANPPSHLTTSRSASNGTSGSSSGTKEKRDGGVESYLKSFKVSLDDPCWKVLPEALKKYKISDDWRHYAMFICYGTTERCVSYDERPLLLFQKLKDANKNPVFMLRHIKDICSPITVARRKQAARLGLDEDGTSSGNGPASAGAGAGPPLSAIPAFSRNSELSHPHTLHEMSKPGEGGNGYGGLSSAQSQWPEDGENDGRVRIHHHAPEEKTRAEGGAAYAVAIYPYLAEQLDELDVVVDDTFIILARTKGWWEVQRDVAGTGEAAESNRKGWVPRGCLLEITMPPTRAVAETRAANASNDHNRGRRPDSPPTRTQVAQNAPILPAKITSTNFPGMALMKYVPKGDHELELTENDLLRVFKRYNHWSYAIKEETGDRGWVPSWYIGKAGSGSNASVPSSSQGTTGN